MKWTAIFEHSKQKSIIRIAKRAIHDYVLYVGLFFLIDIATQSTGLFGDVHYSMREQLIMPLVFVLLFRIGNLIESWRKADKKTQ